MEDLVLFTRQRGASSNATEEELLDAQIQAIEAYAQLHQLRITDRIALTGISSHELFQKMVAYLAEHLSVRAIITYSTDRLLRDIDDFSKFDELLRERSISLFLAREAQGRELKARHEWPVGKWYKTAALHGEQNEKQ
ncbi:MAG: recombinase family protein [Acidobacteria bacterium]|nr:recombinase family protein [Acidobacteriota bacterium]